MPRRLFRCRPAALFLGMLFPAVATTGMQTSLPWKGLLEDAGVYWGELEKDALDAWSAR